MSWVETLSPPSRRADDLDRFSRRYVRLRADLTVIAYVEAHADEFERWVTKARPRRR